MYFKRRGFCTYGEWRFYERCIYCGGDMVLMEPVKDSIYLKNGTIVSALVPGSELH